MEVQFRLKIKPYSINKFFYADRRTKTAAARAWERNTLTELANHEAHLAAISSSFDSSKHGLSLELRAHYPRHFYLNKEGSISARTMDLSNWEKPLIDLLCLPKYYLFKPPLGCKNLNTDDRFIIELKSCKLPSDNSEHFIDIIIRIVEA